ncbi:MAG TPA: hypothetical protein VMT89_03135 [Candidatus Acidoferrales bacterium]|nr:hypothetical protein [Candidatus Acidoferrales bacterium]
MIQAGAIVVVALGGNAISPPRGNLTFDLERKLINRAATELAELGASGARLLVVHGNGPQVGRLLTDESGEDLDIRVAQTQGELGYLIVEALSRHLGSDSAVAVVTRAIIDPNDPAFAHPMKPIGAVLATPPSDMPAQPMLDGGGWRRVVASPRPLAVVEQTAISALLATHHVVAGGGGGIPLCVSGGARSARSAVVDKDWVAAHLATSLGAAKLLFITDVACAFDHFGESGQKPIVTMTVGEARERLARETFARGSMAPKIESAVQFVAATGQQATIAALGSLASALSGSSGTTISP